MSNHQGRSPRRSYLFVPGHSSRMIEKAAGLAADVLLFDLEDGVAFSQKEAARGVTAAGLMKMDFGHRERWVRINPAAGTLAREDLAAIVPAQPDGILIPKVESEEDVRSVSHVLADAEQEEGWPRESIRLAVLIETGLGVMNVKEIAQASTRLDALIFGAEDLTADIGAVRSAAGWELFYARSAVVIAAAAYGLQAVDSVYVDLSDLDGLAEESQAMRDLGYSGKTAIHPNQLAVINEVFSPSAQAIADATALIQAFEDHQDSGVGAFNYQGKMVDMPVVRRAQNIVTRAKMIEDALVEE